MLIIRLKCLGSYNGTTRASVNLLSSHVLSGCVQNMGVSCIIEDLLHGIGKGYAILCSHPCIKYTPSRF